MTRSNNELGSQTAGLSQCNRWRRLEVGRVEAVRPLQPCLL